MKKKTAIPKAWLARAAKTAVDAWNTEIKHHEERIAELTMTLGDALDEVICKACKTLIAYHRRQLKSIRAAYARLQESYKLSWKTKMPDLAS